MSRKPHPAGGHCAAGRLEREISAASCHTRMASSML
jgi:hypothetical protein